MLCLLTCMVSAVQIQTALATNQSTARKRAALYPSGSLDLPEIIINKAASAFNSYHYPIPNPPFQFDEPNPVIPGYLPPVHDPPLNDLSPPYFDPTEPPNQAHEYLPPVATKTLATNMSCLDTSADKFFKATVRLYPSLNTPVIDGATVENCLKTVNNGEFVQLELTGSKMVACGVRLCDTRSMCVKVRVPTVPGLRMLDDQQILLQCRLQEPVLASTKRFRLGPVRMLQGRGLNIGSSTSVTVGGSQRGRNFDMEVALYRQRPGSNVPLGAAVTAGSAVYLGDELLLRAAIRERDGARKVRRYVEALGIQITLDFHPNKSSLAYHSLLNCIGSNSIKGREYRESVQEIRNCWKYGRLSTVTVHSATSPANTSPAQSVTLIDEYGCRVDTMRSVCPDQPRQLAPLTFTVPFRVFAFQPGVVGGGWELPQQEEMVLSVRMVACLEARDCVVQDCNIKSRIRTRVAKRDINNKGNLNNNRSISTDIETYLDFRVVLTGSPEEDDANLMNSTIILTITGLFTLAIIGALVYFQNKRIRSHKLSFFG